MGWGGVWTLCTIEYIYRHGFRGGFFEEIYAGICMQKFSHSIACGFLDACKLPFLGEILKRLDLCFAGCEKCC